MAINNADQYSSDSEGWHDCASNVIDSNDDIPFLPTPGLPSNKHPTLVGEEHPRQRAHARRKDAQRRRLLRYLVQMLQQGEPVGQGQSDPSTQRRRPRLVLLGNQKTLVLGVVLSDRGAAAAAAGAVGS
jgi:hypothetical protein